MPFEPPPWAATPASRISLLSGGQAIPVDQKDFYVFGREKDQVDIHLDSEKVSRCHAAIVHHTDGRVFIIDLQSSHGTFVNGQQLAVHKPTALKRDQRLTFGGLLQEFVVDCDGPSGAAMPSEVRASHLLVKHCDVRRPSSWKETVVTRSRDDALAMIQQFHAQLTAGDGATLQQRFAELASVESHCSSAKRGGDLGVFGPGQMMKSFEDAAFALQVGELSGPVFSDSGVHLILRTQ